MTSVAVAPWLQKSSKNQNNPWNNWNSYTRYSPKRKTTLQNTVLIIEME